MEKKKESKIVGFIKRFAPGLAAGAVILLLAAYLVNIMVVQNKQTAVSVLVLEFMEDTSILEEQVREVIGAGEDQKIEIRSIAVGVEANKAVALTWIRAEVVDVIIGDEEQMTEYAQAGYLKALSETEDFENKETDRDVSDSDSEQTDNLSGDFICGLAEYDKDGKITAIGPETCFGKYAMEIPGLELQKTVIGLAGNVSNTDNAMKLLSYFGRSGKK